ncbi:MAG: RlmE family RNA methyltransferase [Magnetococcales bacterium]|nr:RlmE family RNA methyltransferase [Magnetococcales bacterium]
MPRRRPSSHEWLREHRRDPYVQAAAREGYRSRAAYKLLEIHERPPAGLLRAGMAIVDLGAAPGGWTQVAAQHAGPRGVVVAVDLLAMDPLAGVAIIQGDFLQEATVVEVKRVLGRPADLLLSDMAPNMSGIKAVDQPRGELLAEAALAFAAAILKPQGAAVIKLFEGPGFHDLVREARTAFGQVKVVKPKASRGRSPEHYLLCQGFRASLANMEGIDACHQAGVHI